MQNHAVKVQTRLVYFFIFLVFVFLSVFIYFRSMEGRAIALLFQKDAREKERVFDKLLKLRGASLESIAFDYTYWDEMLAAVVNGNKAWAVTSLSQSTLSNFNINAMWVYNAGRQPFYSINNLKDGRAVEIYFPPAVFDTLLRQRFGHFFVKTPAGLMEIRAATIHPSGDAERKIAPQGYFFAGRLWDSAYIKELSELTDSAIRLEPRMGDAQGYRLDLRKGIITFSKNIDGWDGKPLMQLVISRSSPEIKEFNETSKKYLLFLLLFAGGLLGLAISLVVKWVFLPIRSISSALKDNDLKHLRRLKDEKTEFGDISRLIFEFFHQREEIQGLYKMTQDILEMAPFGIYVANERGGIDYVNSAMLKISGDTEEQFMSLCLFDLPTYKQLGLSDKIRAVFKGEPFFMKSVRYTSKFSGKETVRNMSGMPFEEQGRRKALVFVEDVTEREKLEEMKASLTQMIVHDLNNPLAGILGNAQLLESELNNSLSRDQKNSFNWITYGAHEMQGMVSNLLDINKMEEGKLNLRYEDIDINGLFGEIGNTLNIVARQSEKGISFEALPGLMIKADRDILKRIISNLIGNALKFTPPHTTIKVEAREDKEGNRFVLCVRDQGVGIPKEYLSRVFDKFVQVESAQIRGKTGKGLGLTFCRMAVEAHGGRIWVESEVGKGTAFYFTIPER